MKKKMLGLVSAVAVMTVATACTTKEDKKDSNSDAATSAVKETKATEQSTETSEEETSAAKEKDEKESANGLDGFTDLKSFIKEESEAETLETLASGTGIDTKIADLDFNIAEYELVEITDFHEDLSIPFGRQTEKGGVLMIKYELKNNSKDDVYVPFAPSLTFPGAEKSYSTTRDLIPEDNDTYKELSAILVKENNKLPAGESITGYTSIAFDPDGLSEIMNNGEVTVELPAAYPTDELNYKNRLGDDTDVRLPLSKEGQETISESDAFIKDKITVSNMGEKKIISEKMDLTDTVELSDITVGLKGYQFTEFTPNKAEAPRFEAFDTGIVLLSVQYEIKNEGDKTIVPSTSSATMDINNGKEKMLSENMLLERMNPDEIKKGETKDFIQVFTFDKEEFDKLYKDKDFSSNVKLTGEDAKQLAKGKEFVLPLPTK